MQIGAAGPIAGFIIAVPALIIGLMLSTVVAVDNAQVGIILGDSILMKLLTVVIHPGLPENMDILLHPMAFAGWIGLVQSLPRYPTVQWHFALFTLSSHCAPF